MPPIKFRLTLEEIDEDGEAELVTFFDLGTDDKEWDIDDGDDADELTNQIRQSIFDRSII